MSKATKVTISLPEELVKFADTVAEEKKTSRSQVIRECLKEAERQKESELLKKGYLAMAAEHKKLAELSLAAQKAEALKRQD
jgi:metal-responsive CopG/Arc/MetJ family transcriptional regulator